MIIHLWEGLLMKMQWISLKVWVSLVAVLLVVSACGSDNNDSSSSSGGKTKLTMSAWGNPEEIKGYQRALDAYEEENPDVTIELIPIPSDNYEQKVLTQLSGGDSTDVFYVGSEWISKLIETGKVEDLSDFLEGSDSYVHPDEFADGLWGASRTDDEIFGVPVDNNPYLMYYNKNVLEDAGIEKGPQEHYEEGTWNWDTFAEMTADIVAAGKKGYIVESGGDHTFSWIWSNGGELYDDDGNIIIKENEQAQETFEYLESLVEGENVTYAGTLPEGQGAEAMFMSNQVGFVSAGRWFTPMFSENESLDFDYIPWPTNTGEEMEPAAIATAYMSVASDSEHVEEAMKFMSYYTGVDGQEARLRDNGNAVPSVDGIDDIITEDSIPEHAEYLIDAREIGIVEEHQKAIPGLDKEIVDIMDLLYLGKENVETTIDAIHDKASEMIEEYQD